MSFKRYKSKKNDDSFPSMIKFFNNIVNISGNTWKIKSEHSPIRFDFDIFYLCMIIGIKYNLRENDDRYQSDVFFNQDIFPDNSYRDVDNYIVPIILKRIADIDNYNLDNKDSTRQLINDYVVPSRLDKKMLVIMNEYSLGGYIKLLNEFDFVPPQDVGNFFIKFNKLINY